MQMVPRPTPDADALADAMRRLGTNPRDLASLIEAGELSLKLGDVNAAAALFKRAEGVDPMNGRVKAGMARILVTQQRPGEALRYFDQATGYGLDPRSFAGDRALAYDLIGEQERAQRDYRVAMAQGANDEIERRYALSLGISGKREQALKLIDDQLRKNDRSAWRVRAFVLAMTGDVPGAEKIASTMMPPGMGAALAPFFGRLAALPAVDRAFAVHFGELRATPQRLADARMAPALPVLPPEAPVQVAAVEPAPKVERVTASEMRKRVREQTRRQQRDQARSEAKAGRKEAPAAPVAVASAPADPGAGLQPPSYGGGVAYAPAKEVVQALPASAAPPPRTPAALPVTTMAQATPVPRPSAPVSPAPVRAKAEPPQPAIETPSARATGAAPKPGFSSVDATPAAVATAPASSAAPTAVAASSVPVAPQMSEDSILARIMAGISIPGEELGVAPVRPPAPEPVAAAPGTTIATAETVAAADAARKAAETERRVQEARTQAEPAKATPGKVETAKVESAGSKSTATKAGMPKGDPLKVENAKAEPAKGKAATRADVADKTEKEAVDPKKLAAERKAAAAKKLADAKKAEAAKKAAEEAKAAKADPARIWVQVAGGANEKDLHKAWTATQAKAAALKGKSAYSTPLRATNRVVTGPFKTDAEARAFVNTLAKEGVSAFPFTSEKGQKMTKLGPK